MAQENDEIPDNLVVNVSEEPTELNPGRGQRMPPSPLLCSISRVDGIQISGFENAEIVSFEILDAYGNTVALLQNEPSFIETIFSLNGEYRILFRLNDRILTGWTII